MVTYKIQIQEYNAATDSWRGYYTDDLQVEFTMLDPYIRQSLLPIDKDNFQGWYQATFQVPDQHGVFHFKVVYNKPLFTFIDHADKIPVRPFRHDEYQRFLFCAYPYYFSVFSTIFGFIVFLYYFLYSKE